jgi:Cellulose biosynthesis protein BcsS
MRCRRRVCATVVTAAALSVCFFRVSVGLAWASDDEDGRVLLFSGRDIWRNGAFAYGGFMFAPGGLEQDGVLLKVLLSGGLYRNDAENFRGEHVIGAEWLTQVLPGWRIKRGDAEFKFFMGPEFQNHRLWPDDPANRLRGHSFGLRVAVDLWYEPTPDTI